jgi:hypothetical protein
MFHMNGWGSTALGVAHTCLLHRVLDGRHRAHTLNFKITSSFENNFLINHLVLSLLITSLFSELAEGR